MALLIKEPTFFVLCFITLKVEVITNVIKFTNFKLFDGLGLKVMNKYFAVNSVN